MKITEIKELEQIIDWKKKGLTYEDIAGLIKSKFGKEITPQAVHGIVQNYKPLLEE